ncbi:MAG: RNA 2',3'-cyclic phosphodiesterase [Halobacteria archaeon]
MTRVFLAVQPPTDVYSTVEKLQDRLGAINRDLNSVETTNLHVTVKYLGNESDVEVEAVAEVLRELRGVHDGFELELRGLGAFPEVTDPQDIWVGVGRGAGQLQEIHDDLQKKLVGLNLAPRDEYDYVPHMTVAQIREDRGRSGPADLGFGGEDLQSFMKQNATTKYGVISVDDLCLFRTIKRRGKIEQSVLRRFPLE